MAKLVTKFKYLKSSSRKSPGGYASYIATRDGVEKIDDSQKSAPATAVQKKFISKILRDFSDSFSMPEYDDYIRSPTRGNASEFISRALENVSDEIMSTKTYADYIATRPRAERIGSHGLFTDEGVQVQLSKVSQELNSYEGNIWTSIISLRREDAERLGFNCGERWRQFLRSHTQDLSDHFHIPLKDLRWYAAFHNEGHHPHVHLIVYSMNPKEGYLSEQGVEKLRSSFATDIFRDDLLSVYEKQTEHRDSLRKSSKDIVGEIVSEINSGVYDNPELERLLITLSDRLSKVKGKKQYGYLSAKNKSIVDAIVSELSSDSRIASLYNLWYEQKENVIKTYTEHVPDRIALVDNPEFKSIKNAIIQEALRLKESVKYDDSFDSVVPDNSEDSVSDSEEEIVSGIPEDNSSKMWVLYREAKQFLNSSDEQYDPDKAITLLIDSANLGCWAAKYLLGKFFLQGKIVSKNVEYALRWLEELVEEGNSYAEYLLGKALLFDDDLEQNAIKAEHLLRESAAHGNRCAAYMLGRELINGIHLQQNIQEGLMLLSSSADSGFSSAQYWLGKLLLKSEVIPKDPVKAVEYLKKASEQNNSFAAYLAGKTLLTEPRIKDVLKAIELLKKAAGMENHHAEYLLGKIYLFGKDAPQNTKKAISYLSSAADHGNQFAQQLLHSYRNNRNWRAAMSSFRLLNHLCRIIQNRCPTKPRDLAGEIDRKLRRKIDEKKQAQGIKQ